MGVFHLCRTDKEYRQGLVKRLFGHSLWFPLGAYVEIEVNGIWSKTSWSLRDQGEVELRLRPSNLEVKR